MSLPATGKRELTQTETIVFPKDVVELSSTVQVRALKTIPDNWHECGLRRPTPSLKTVGLPAPGSGEKQDSAHWFVMTGVVIYRRDLPKAVYTKIFAECLWL